MSSSWNAEESCIELTMRVEELNYTIYGCTNALRALNGICSDTRSIYKSESINSVSYTHLTLPTKA